MVLSTAQASKLIACATYDYENQVNKDLGKNKRAKVMSDTFENFFTSSALQKVAQIFGEKFLGKYLGSDVSAYGSSMIYLLFHRAMLAGRNYEYHHSKNSYVPEFLPKLYKNFLLPAVTFVKETIYGITENKINPFKYLATTAAVIGSSFFDKNVAYPGTREIREAKTLGGKLLKAVKNKLIYVASYFLYQGLVATMYGEQHDPKNPLGILEKLGKGIEKAVRLKTAPTIAIAAADSLTDIVNGEGAQTKIPSPLIAAVLRFIFAAGVTKLAPKPILHENDKTMTETAIDEVSAYANLDDGESTVQALHQGNEAKPEETDTESSKLIAA